MQIPLWTWIKRAFRSKQQSFGGISQYNKEMADFLRGAHRSDSGVLVTEKTALYSTAVMACQKVIAESIASLPLIIYERADKGKERAYDHAMYPVLHDQANPYMTSFVFRELMQHHLLTYGNAFAEIQRNGAGNVVALWPLLPDRTTVKLEGDIKYYETIIRDQVKTLSAKNVLHIPGLGFDGLQGYSPIQMAMQAIGLGMAAEEFGARFYGNGMNVGAVAEHPGKLTEQGSKNLRESLEKTYSGLGKSHRLLLLEEGMKFQKTPFAPNEAQFLETRKFQINEIARLYRVPPHMIQDLDRATFCLPADVEVFTENGPKSIAEVAAEDKVWSFDGETLVLSKVKSMICSGEDEVLEIKTTNRTIRANSAHRLLVRRKHADPKPGPGGYQSIKWSNEYVPAGELRVGDTLVCLDELSEEGTDITPTRRANVSFMEFCGLLLGDGNVRPKWGVSIARANDANYMDHYREIIKREFVSFGHNGNGRSRDIPTVPVTIQEQDRQTRFASVLAAEELTELGFLGNARTKVVPEWVFKLTPKLKRAFLRGYLDADGSVDKKGRIAFHSVNKKMLSQMRHLCMSLGVPVTNMQHRIVRTTLPNGKGHTSEVYAFTCSDPAKNCLIWSNDARYQERLRNGNPFDRKGRAYPSYGGKDFEVPGCGLSRITSIEKQATEPVYDLEVEGTHSFIANGVIVHNSNIEYQSIEFVMHTLRPWLVRWEQSIFTQLLMPEERKRYFAEFLVEGLLRGDMQSRYQAYATGRQNGWLSADDIRELENMNKLPDGKGEIYLVPLNMVPVDQVMDAPRLPQQQEPDDENARKIAQSLKVEKRQRGVAHRERIMHAWEPIYKDAFDRIVRRERNDLKRLITKNLRDKETMKEALEKFYATDGEFRAYILQVLRPVNQGLAEQIAQAAGDEIGDHITTEELQRFAENYLQSRADNHLGASKNQLMLLLEEEEALEELEQRLDEWDERRADKVAANEAHRAGNAVARTVWIVGGIQVLMWVTMGTNPCEYCELMNGRTVSITKPFLEAGAGISGENGERFEVHESKLHPPLHSACMCGVAPGI